MTIGWQEIIALGVVAFAVFILLRRGFGKNADSASCCGKSGNLPPPPDRGIRIKELHQIEIERSAHDSEL